MNFDEKNLDSYFLDSIRLGYSKAFYETADDSFIDKINQNCLTLGASTTIILNENCRPDLIFTEQKIREKTEKYVGYYLAEYLGSSVDVYCKIEKEKQEILKCESDKIKLISKRQSAFFNYTIEREIKLNNSLDIENNEFKEVLDIYTQAKACKDINCVLNLNSWKKINEIETRVGFPEFLVFSLETNKAYTREQNAPIKWIFATKIE
jgi:hypothetical protein